MEKTAEAAAKQAAKFGISSEEFNKKLKAYVDDEVLMQDNIDLQEKWNAHRTL